ncbi:MAG: glycine cleavage system protein GcvH [Bauldia sp.]|nr:glycine cleavage system protein GcvH [Bauldia sp.]
MMTGYTKDHEWIAAGAGEATVGISHYAQDQLGDVVFVELPQVGKKLKKGDVAAVVESVKAASEVYSPITGEVIAVNDTLTGDPALVNRSPEADGWFMRLRVSDPKELDGLMDEAAYKSFVDTI